MATDASSSIPLLGPNAGPLELINTLNKLVQAVKGDQAIRQEQSVVLGVGKLLVHRILYLSLTVGAGMLNKQAWLTY